MARLESTKLHEPERVESTLDEVLVTALRQNFEIKRGYHVDRNEILEFLRSVIEDHPELDFVLQHRDTKLSSRVYKAFPKVTTKRVAIPNLRGKKTWTYTNLRRTTSSNPNCQPRRDVVPQRTQSTRATKTEPKRTLDPPSNSMMRIKPERKKFTKSKRSFPSASMVHMESLYDSYKHNKRESILKTSRNPGHVPQQSYLGRFNDMLKWVKEDYMLDADSSIQVKHIVEMIKAKFKINITYKQSHKLIYAAFPGATNRVEHPVKLEAQGGYYSYKGIASIPKQRFEREEGLPSSESLSSPPKPSSRQHVREYMSAGEAWPPRDDSPIENERKRIFRTRKRFIEACSVLKPAEEALLSRARRGAQPITSEFASVVSKIPPKGSDVSSKFNDVSAKPSEMSTRFSDVSSRNYGGSPRCSNVSSGHFESLPRFPEASHSNSELTPRFSELAPRFPEVAARCSEISPRYPEVSRGFPNGSPRLSGFSSKPLDTSSRYYELPPMLSDEFRRCENNWQRLYEELRQERDQAIVERNQAMVSLMEIEREQTTRTHDDLPRRQPSVPDTPASGQRIPPTSEDRENSDWLQRLMSRSNTILGEPVSEASAVYFPRSTLQGGSCNPRRYPKRAGFQPGDYVEMERYEQFKQERDTRWKNWIDKLIAEKDDIIQQLKLDKMEVIQRMELEKSDAVERVEGKLTNQITILTREMRELKELLNHTMNERALAIAHAQKLVELVGEEKLMEAGLENFPFDVTKDHVVRPVKKSPGESETQKAYSLCFGKSNKRKQSMPAKVKKILRIDSTVSTKSVNPTDNNDENTTEIVSTESIDLPPDTMRCCEVAAESGVVLDNFPIDNESIGDGSTDIDDHKFVDCKFVHGGSASGHPRRVDEPADIHDSQACNVLSNDYYALNNDVLTHEAIDIVDDVAVDSRATCTRAGGNNAINDNLDAITHDVPTVHNDAVDDAITDGSFDANDHKAASNGVNDIPIIEGTINNEDIDGPSIDNEKADQSVMVSKPVVSNINKRIQSVHFESNVTTAPLESPIVSIQQPKQDSPCKQVDSVKLDPISNENSNSECFAPTKFTVDVSMKPLVASNSEKILDSTALVDLESVNSKRDVETDGSCNSKTISLPEKKSSGTVSTSVLEEFQENSPNTRNLITLSKLTSLTPPEINLTDTWNILVDKLPVNSVKTTLTTTEINNNLEKLEHDVSVNAQRYSLESSRSHLHCTSNFENYESELAHNAGSNFRNYEIPNDLTNLPMNVELRKFKSETSKDVKASATASFINQGSSKSFEESVNSTFLKYFPDVPKNSMNLPLTTDSSKCFGDVPRIAFPAVPPDSKMYGQGPGNQTITYVDAGAFPKKSSLSSIDYLNSMVENIGKSLDG